MGGEVQNGGMGSVDWAALLKGITDTVKTEGTTLDEPTAILDGDSVVLTVRDSATGEVRTATLAPPEIDGVNDDAELSEFRTLAESTIAEMVEDLKDVAREFGAEMPKTPPADETPGRGSINSGGVQKVLFDIYAIIQLMQKLGQAQRDTARAIRYSELKMQAASIQSQADHQRLAAVLGAIVGAVTCVAQVGMLGFSAFKAGQAQSLANKTSANQQLNMSHQDLALLNGAKSSDAATANTTKMGKALSVDQKRAVDAAYTQKMQPATQKLAGAQTQLDTAKARLSGCQERLSKVEGRISELSAKTDVKVPGQEGPLVSDAEIEARVRELDVQLSDENLDPAVREQATAERTTLKTALGARKELTAQRQQKTELVREEHTLQKKVETCQKSLDEAKAGYATALEDFMSDYDAQFAEARSAAELAEGNAAEKGGKFRNNEFDTAKSEAQSKVSEMAKIRAYAKAKTVETKFKTGMTESLVKDKAAAQSQYERSEKSLDYDRGYKSAMAGSRKWEMLSQMNAAFNGFFQNVTHLVSSLEDVKATLEQADQKKWEQFREETGQLFSQAQELVTNVNNLLRAVVQAEDQTMQQIIRV